MDDELTQRWREYRQAIEDAYREDGGRLVFDARVPDEILDGIVERSEGLSHLLEELLGERPPEDRAFPLGPGEGELLTEEEERRRREHEAAAFALAGIDLAVGDAILLSSREEAEAAAREVAQVPPPPIRSLEELPPMEVLLWKAGQVFGEGERVVGAEPGPPWVVSLAASAVDELVDRGAAPAYEFGKGMLSFGIGGLAGAAGALDPLHRLVDGVMGRLNVGVRLLRSALTKLGRTVGSDQFLGWVFEEMVERLGLDSVSLESAGKSVFRRLIRADSSLEDVVQVVRDGGQRRDLAALQADLDRLRFDFADRMWWAEMAAELIGVGGFVVAILALGAGNIALGAAYGIGFTVCLFATADRLDTVPGGLGWIAGVPTLVRER
jgi:hypothetical protein